ncbi:MAG TPA: trypsin-like peptidase domain-containing protein, partial [Novosphingobium sp.]|nr:trypsin-like peptidase domain-containing protein [Novosphingobium sp.]
MRYAYGLTAALLLGGTALSLASGNPAGAQVAQNEASRINPITPRAGAPASFADLTQQLAPAVVNISTRQRVQVNNVNPFAGTPFADLFGGSPQGQGPQTREAQSLGSGFIISADGYVVTNNHVVQPQGRGELESITITMPDGTEYPARLVGRDAASDLAVLKMDGKRAFPFVKFGDSSQARVGDWIIAIGNPFGLGGSVTSGIISAVYRNTGSGTAYDRYIQTDAAINRGNSGGPMFDMDGGVIGVNTAIFSPSGGSIGIGFAIPSNQARLVIDQLREFGFTRRGWIGVRIQSVDAELAEGRGLNAPVGALVANVSPGGPAEVAGIVAGDVILTFDGKSVHDMRQLPRIVAETPIGKTVEVVVWRD